MVQTIFAVHRESVAHRHADRVGDKHRNAAGALRDQLAIGPGEAHGKVFVLVNIRAKRRACDVGVDLIGDRHQSVADHFEGDRVDGVLCRSRLKSCTHIWLTGFFSRDCSDSLLPLRLQNMSQCRNLSSCHPEQTARDLVLSHLRSRDVLGESILSEAEGPRHDSYGTVSDRFEGRCRLFFVKNISHFAAQ